MEARHAAVAHPQRPQHRHGAHDRLQVRRHRVLVGVLEQPRRPDQEDQDLGEVVGRARRRAAVAVDELLAERRHLGERVGVAGMRQHDPAPDQPGQRLEPGQAVGGQRPGAEQVALVRRQRPPEAVAAARIEALGQERRVHGPALGAPAGEVGLPARSGTAAEAVDPVLHPGLRQRPRRPVAERGEVVEPEAGLPPRLEPRVGQRHLPDRRPADRDLVPERPPVAVEERLPALGIAEQHRLGQGRRDLRPPAEPGPPRPDPVAPGPRRPGDPLAQGPQRQCGSGHARGFSSGSGCLDRSYPLLPSPGPRCHAAMPGLARQAA